MSFLKKIVRSNRFSAAIFERRVLSRKFLKPIGWYESYFKGTPIDGDGNPIPWITYPAIHFLDGRLSKEMKVFEFGSGNSTIYFANRVKSVISVEHDKGYFDFISLKLKSYKNVEYRFATLGDNYSSQILEFTSAFEVVVVDGRERVECAKNSVKALSPNGVLIWDNSDRERYKEGFDFLKENGFKRLDFKGLGPISHEATITSVFYRSDNCLGI